MEHRIEYTRQIKDDKLVVQVSPEMKEAAKGIAHMHHMTLSAYVRLLVERDIARFETPKNPLESDPRAA